MRALLATFAVALLLSGCRASSESPEAGISFGRGGGLTGDFLGIEIDPGGEARIEIRRGIEEETIDFEVSAAEFEELQEHLASADVGGLGESRSETCADCFGYSLEFGDEVASADSSTVTEEFLKAADPLVRLLREQLPPSTRY